MSELIPILAITVCAPLWIIFHYITKMKTSKGLTAEDEKMLMKSGNPPRKWKTVS